MVLETKRLILREMTQEDFPGLSKILQDEEVMYAYEGAFTHGETQDWMDKQILRYRDFGFGLWAVVLKETGSMIGQCGVTMQDYQNRQIMEVGYLFQKEYWHRGYALEAASACKEYAFDVLGAEEVYSIIRDTNHASQKVAKRNGMICVDQFNKHYRGIDMPHLLFQVKKEQSLQRIVDNMNILARFCGKRDLDPLTSESLKQRYGMDQADVMVLFGGSILNGGDLLAQAIKDNIARKYVISGGAGHTTETLRQEVSREFPQIETKDRTEAEIFNDYLLHRYGVQADYLERDSTNCGNNITFLLKLLEQEKIPYQHIILMQDATMQHRMEAGLRKYVTEDVTIINYAAYSANVTVCNGELAYDSAIHGMWDMRRYVDLLMGEIPRLSDDTEGYGPNGKGFIAHVDVPEEVRIAFEELKKTFGDTIRVAEEKYSGK